MADIIRREKEKESTPMMDDAVKYDILKMYKTGSPPAAIAEKHGLTAEKVGQWIREELRGLNTMKQSMQLVYKSNSQPPNLTETMNDVFLSLVPDRAEVYAFYFGMTGSNEYALKESGLDEGIPKTKDQRPRKYALMVRGKYLREIPSVRKYIEEIQEKKLQDAGVAKPKVQSEILAQIEEMKELAHDDPRYRGHLLKAIELLGKTIGAFQDNVKIEDASTKSGLELLMEKAKGEVDTYEVVDGKD